MCTYNPLDLAMHPQLPYVPKHLYHMLFELFKNSMRAVVEHVDSDGSDIYPPIDCLMVKGSEDVTIRISDQGGGIPRSMVESLFTYTYSTAPQPPRAGSTHAPLAGYGFGLPLSRVYARYFQGDLVLNSVEGHGIDAVIFLKVNSTFRRSWNLW
jgi:pyruvate dehydrogenase kinase 2/3/4